MTPRGRRDLLWAALVTVLVLGPALLSRGFVLQGDMVFVPEQPWKGAWLGLDGSVGRFVPGDAVVWTLTQALPGDLVQKLLLSGALVLGGAGVGRLVATQPFAGRAAAITLFLWNPWVLERLAIGQWGVVVGYCLLPWVVTAAQAWREDPRAGWPALVVVLGVSAWCSPPAALIAVLTALCVIGTARRWSSVAQLLGLSLVLNLPWLVPSLLSPTGLSAARGQFAGFAARGESELGLLASLASLGGIWKDSVVPPERTNVVVVLLSLALTCVALVGLRRSRDLDPVTRRGLVLLAVLSVAVTVVPALPVLHSALDDLASAVPPLGLVRDSHRFLGPAALALSVGLGAATGEVWRRAGPGLESLRVVAVLLVLWPVLALPSLAWGLNGDLRPVDYPGEWSALRKDFSARPTVVLPWAGGYRGFEWNRRTAVLDPAPRFFPGEVLVDDRLYLDDRVLTSEDPLLAEIADALESSDPAAALSSLGIAQVLLHKDNGVSEGDVPTGTVLHDGPGLRLVALPGPTPLERPGPPPGLVIVGNLVAFVTIVLGVVTLVGRSVYRPSQRSNPWEGN